MRSPRRKSGFDPAAVIRPQRNPEAAPAVLLPLVDVLVIPFLSEVREALDIDEYGASSSRCSVARRRSWPLAARAQNNPVMLG